MNSDRNWMNHWGVSDRRKAEYIAGVNEFLDFAFSGKENGTVLRCPCLRCNNQNFHVRQKIREHLLLYGIVRSYSPWVHHGENDEYEDYSSDEGYEGEVSGSEDDLMMGDDMAPLVFDATNVANLSVPTNNDELPKEFDELMKDVEAELYPGCKTFKRLEFLVKLLHIKVSNKWSDKSFSMLLKALHRAFNYDKRFPENCYQAKRYTRALGLDYIKIDACIKTEAGYVKGLGPGPRLPRKGKSGRESDELRELNAEISVLKASNEELKASNEELKAFNMELKSEINQMRIEAIERDKRLKEEIKEMLQLIPR